MKINLYQESWDIFVRNIIWLRKHYKIPKNKMAEILGIDIAALNKIEKNEIPDEVTVEILLNAEKFFGIPIKDFIGHFIYE